MDVGFWIAVGTSAAVVGGLARPIRDIVITRMALHNSKPGERREILDGLSKIRQFSPWSWTGPDRGSQTQAAGLEPVEDSEEEADSAGEDRPEDGR